MRISLALCVSFSSCPRKTRDEFPILKAHFRNVRNSIGYKADSKISGKVDSLIGHHRDGERGVLSRIERRDKKKIFSSFHLEAERVYVMRRVRSAAPARTRRTGRIGAKWSSSRCHRQGTVSPQLESDSELAFLHQHGVENCLRGKDNFVHWILLVGVSIVNAATIQASLPFTLQSRSVPLSWDRAQLCAVANDLDSELVL